MIKYISLTGKNLFHVKYMRLSYRIRGNVARTHTNKVAIIIVFTIKNASVRIIECPEKRTDVKRLIIKILAYSAIKIRANMAPPYSTLNPDTSSDSPSAKSNGVRFVSARLVINHIMDSGRIISITQE